MTSDPRLRSTVYGRGHHRGIPDRHTTGGPGRPAGPAGPDPLARPAARCRLGLWHRASRRTGAGRVLAHRVRLAGARAAAELLPAVHHGDRRTAGALPARAFGGAGGAATD